MAEKRPMQVFDILDSPRTGGEHWVPPPKPPDFLSKIITEVTEFKNPKEPIIPDPIIRDVPQQRSATTITKYVVTIGHKIDGMIGTETFEIEAESNVEAKKKAEELCTQLGHKDALVHTIDVKSG